MDTAQTGSSDSVWAVFIVINSLALQKTSLFLGMSMVKTVYPAYLRGRLASYNGCNLSYNREEINRFLLCRDTQKARRKNQ